MVSCPFAEVPAWAYVVVAVLGCTASLFMMTKLATMEIVNGVIQLPRRYEVGATFSRSWLRLARARALVCCAAAARSCS